MYMSTSTVSSARSGDLLCNGKMLVMRTTENPANPICQLVGTEQSVGLDHLAFCVDPLGLYGVEPRTLLGQKATDDPHSACTLLDFSVVSSEPAPDLPGDVPASVVPDQKQHFLARRLKLLGAPREKLLRYGTHGPPVDEAQPRIADLRQVEPVAGDGFRFGVSSLARDRWGRRRGFPSS